MTHIASIAVKTSKNITGKSKFRHIRASRLGCLTSHLRRLLLDVALLSRCDSRGRGGRPRASRRSCRAPTGTFERGLSETSLKTWYGGTGRENRRRSLSRLQRCRRHAAGRCPTDLAGREGATAPPLCRSAALPRLCRSGRRARRVCPRRASCLNRRLSERFK